MKPIFLPIAALAAILTVNAFAAEPTEEAKSEEKKKEEIRSLILADANNKPVAPAAKPEAAANANEAAVAPEPKPAETPTATETVAAPKPPDQPTTLLPQIEVNKSRITNLDIEIDAQDKAIKREKANIKPTKLDNTLNNAKLTKGLAIFGGSSSDERSALAQERVSMMEEEKELLESMKLARTKEEKAELQQELDALRATRRELDLAPK